MSIWDWEETEYPKIFNEIKQIGKEAKMAGLPRVCNLGHRFRTSSGEVLKPWLSAWEQGYDEKESIPEAFKVMDKALLKENVRELNERDL